MKNEIGRKLTSLTIMAIMFAGGMTLAVPGFMPATEADTSVTDGMLTISSEFIQGAAVLEVVINDPGYSSTTDDLSNGPDVTISGTDYIATQATNGKWYAYFVDNSTSILMDRDSTGMGISYAVSDELSVSYGTHQIEYNSGSDQDASAVSVSYTMGSLTIAGSMHSVDNIANTATNDREAYELNLAFAF